MVGKVEVPPPDGTSYSHNAVQKLVDTANDRGAGVNYWRGQAEYLEKSYKDLNKACWFLFFLSVGEATILITILMAWLRSS